MSAFWFSSMTWSRRATAEKELYRMAIPPEMEIYFADVGSASRSSSVCWRSAARTSRHRDIGSMHRLVKGVKAIGSVNLGGIHHRAGAPRSFVTSFLHPTKSGSSGISESAGVEVTAQDVPSRVRFRCPKCSRERRREPARGASNCDARRAAGTRCL